MDTMVQMELFVPATTDLVSLRGIAEGLKRFREGFQITMLGTDSLVGYEVSLAAVLLDMCEQVLHLTPAETQEVLGEATYLDLMRNLSDVPYIEADQVSA